VACSGTALALLADLPQLMEIKSALQVPTEPTTRCWPVRCNPNVISYRVTEIELAVMQLLNDSCFRVTAEANRRAFRIAQWPTYHGSPSHVHVRDGTRMENSCVNK
jgi:hypothetical protein